MLEFKLKGKLLKDPREEASFCMSGALWDM